MGDINVRIFDTAFSTWTKSASLREENKGVHPTYFKWPLADNQPRGIWPTFYTDHAIIPTPLGKTFSPGTKRIAWLIEPRCLRPENYEMAKKRAHEFHTVLSYDKEFLKEIPSGRWYPMGGSSIAFDKWGIYPKTKDVCLFLSKKQTTEGHKIRHAIAGLFGDKIDVYGDGANKPIKHKFEVLKDYRYCVVVENCWIDSYFSEKLIDALSVGCIPIYWGCPGRHRYFQESGMFTIIREMNSTISHLEWLLDYIKDQQVFNDVSLNSQDNIKKAKQYRICENWIFENYPDLFTMEID